MKNTCIILFIILFSNGIYAQEKINVASKNVVQFIEANEAIIPLEDRLRRKFDNAVIADLDQDGYLDLLLTEHSRRVELYWNNKGTFVKGDPFIFGDTHGLAVGDYNQDGLIDVLVQPGGGDGKKLSKTLWYQVDKNRKITGGDAFNHFENSRGRAVKFIDANNNGGLDLVTSAFPQNNLQNQAHVLYAKDADLQFKFKDYLPYGDRFNMRTLVTDFNNDGVTDILFYGGSKLVAVQCEGDFEFKDVTKGVLGNLENTDNVHSISEIDFDNDGDLDLFLTRSKEPFDSESDYDEVSKSYYFFDRRKAFMHDNLKIEGDLKIENLQMAFPDFDVFIGADKHLFEREMDRHGHHDLTLTQTEAKGWPTDTSKPGLYIGYLGDGYWRVGGETDSPTSGVIHNVVEKPNLNLLGDMPAKLLENRNGVFVEVSAQLGIEISEQTSSAAVGDFNNDGWSDIFVVRYGHSAKQIEQILYLNIEGNTFVRSENHRIIRQELGAVGIAADAFDYDNDGDLDIIYANERGGWHLFTNNSKTNNNYIVVNVGTSPSGKATAMGATLTFSACDNQYKRVVGATSSPYSHSYNTYLHVGLGTCENLKEVIVTWTNGEKMTLKIEDLNKVYHVGNEVSKK